MSADIQLDYESLLEVAKGFMDYSDLLKNIDSFIEGLLATLKADYFVGLISTTLLEAYTTAVRARLREVIETFINMSNDLNQVVAEDQASQAERRRSFNEG